MGRHLTGGSSLPDGAGLPGTGPSPRLITLRAVLLGLAGTVLICGLTPYNDYALNNTFLVGNNLPLGVVMLMFLFAVCVNGPLNWISPRWSLSAGEMTVAMAMMLVSCAIPSSGLLRYMVPSIISPFWLARSNDEYRLLLESLGLPLWIYPEFSSSSVADWMNDPVTTSYLDRWSQESSPPYAAWIRPVLAWGLFTFALFGALLCMTCLVRRQWIDNERLAFPLAQIQLALVEQPRPGRMLADSFRHRAFWIAFGGVFLLHTWNGLASYWQYVPRIPVQYDLVTLFTEPPWSDIDFKAKNAAVFFTVVGVSYYLSSSVAFSLWAFFILDNVRRVVLSIYGGQTTIPGRLDESIGAALAFAAAFLWVGRHHWWLIVRQAFRGPRRGEPRGRYLSYPAAFWGTVGCIVLMGLWLVVAGCSVLAASVTIGLLLLAFLIIARVIAETGLVHGQLLLPLDRPWVLLSFYGQSHAIPTKSFYLMSMLNATHYDYREVVPVYASHAIKVADQTAFDGRDAANDTPADRRIGRRFVAVLALALVVGYFVGFASTLWTEYTYSMTRDEAARWPLNAWGAQDNPRWRILAPTLQHERGVYHFSHDPAGHMAGGFVATMFLAIMRLRFTWWPLHPVGVLMLGTFPMNQLWFSIFWGWIAKTLLVKFGGSRAYQNAKPFFLGLIVGESMAAGFWLVMGIVLSALDYPYRPINIMPG